MGCTSDTLRSDWALFILLTALKGKPRLPCRRGCPHRQQPPSLTTCPAESSPYTQTHKVYPVPYSKFLNINVCLMALFLQGMLAGRAFKRIADRQDAGLGDEHNKKSGF